MKRKDILKKLEEAGFTFTEGGNHTKAYDSSGNDRTAIPRHMEVKKWTVNMIERQTGVKLQ